MWRRRQQVALSTGAEGIGDAEVAEQAPQRHNCQLRLSEGITGLFLVTFCQLSSSEEVWQLVRAGVAV